MSFFFCSVKHASTSASVFVDVKDVREMVIFTYFQSYIILNAIYLYIARQLFCNNFLHRIFPVDHLSPCDPTQRKGTQIGDYLLEKPRGRQTWVSFSFKCTAENAVLRRAPQSHHEVQICFTRFKSDSSSREACFMSQATVMPNRLLKMKLRSLKMIPKTSINNLILIRILSSFHG